MKLLRSILIIFLLSASMLSADELHKVEMTIRIECPTSEELEALIATMPTPDCPPETNDYDEWSKDCINSMNQLKLLISSGKTYNSSYSIHHTFFDEL